VLQRRSNAFLVLRVRSLIIQAKHIAIPAQRDALHMMASLVPVPKFQQQHHRRNALGDTFLMVQVGANLVLQEHTGKAGYA
jgi:hypothetical protein